MALKYDRTEQSIVDFVPYRSFSIKFLIMKKVEAILLSHPIKYISRKNIQTYKEKLVIHKLKNKLCTY